MIKNLKNRIRSSKSVCYVVAFIYNMLFSNCRLKIIRGKICAKGVFLKGTTIYVKGGNNQLIFGKGSSLTECEIYVHGNRCRLDLAGGRIAKTTLYIEDDESKIEIGENFTMGSGHIAATEGKSIFIGNDCMFSNDIEIRNGDSHSIKNELGLRINEAQDVCIGNHVWLGAHVRVLKGSIIPESCVIANSAVVTSKLATPYSIYGGMPAKVLKSNILWDRCRN